MTNTKTKSSAKTLGRVGAALLGAQTLNIAPVLGLEKSAHDFVWPDNAKAAIALTYDDSLESHLNYVIPQLDAHKMRGTFFLTIDRTGFYNFVEEWRAAAKTGHELANHTLAHPCRADVEGVDRSWVPADTDLDDYTPARMVRELRMTNIALNLLDGETRRTFAYPCGEATAGGVSYIDDIKPVVTAGRGVSGGSPSTNPFEIDLYRVPTLGAEEKSGEELIAYVDQIIDDGGFGTLTFHGVGAEYLSVTHDAHAALLAHLKAREGDIWVGTFKEISDYVRDNRDAD